MIPIPEIKIAQALSDAKSIVRLVDIQVRSGDNLLYGVIYKRPRGLSIMHFVDKYPKKDGYWPPIPDEIFRSMTSLARLTFDSRST